MLCEASNFMVAAPMKTATAPEICNTIMDHFMGYFGTPTRIVYDQGPSIYVTLMSMVFTLIWYTCHPQPAPQITSPLMAEHGIKSLTNILMKHLTGLGDNWPLYCKTCNAILQFLCYPQTWTI